MPFSLDKASETPEQAAQRRIDSASQDVLDSQPGRVARMLMGAPLLNPVYEDIEPPVRKHSFPKVTPGPSTEGWITIFSLSLIMIGRWSRLRFLELTVSCTK